MHEREREGERERASARERVSHERIMVRGAYPNPS